MAGVTVGGIYADVYIDGYRKGIDDQTGPWREVVYILPWGDSDGFMDALRGINTPVVVGGAIIYPIPHQYPGNPILFCMEVWAEGVGTPKPDAKLLAFDKAFVHATYRVPRVDIPGIDNANAFGNQSLPWTRDSMRGYTINYPMPAGSGIDKAGTAELPARKLDWLIPHVEYTRHRMMVPYLDPELMESLVGKINQDVMWNKAIGTIRFEDFDTDPVPQTDGSIMQEIRMRFTWRQYDWNYEPSDNGFIWRQWWDGTNYRYPYADLMQLFQP